MGGREQQLFGSGRTVDQGSQRTTDRPQSACWGVTNRRNVRDSSDDGAGIHFHAKVLIPSHLAVDVEPPLERADVRAPIGCAQRRSEE